MIALVTGAGGFLGKAVVRRLLERGHVNLRCMVRSDAKRAELQAIARAYPAAKVEFAEGDLLSRPEVDRAVSGVEVVYHLAAGMRGSPADLFLNTVVGSRNLLDAATAQPPFRRAVLISSFSVYGTAALPRNSVITESTPLEPHPEKRDPYAHSKLRQELLFHEYRERRGFELVTMRPGVIYGPGGAEFSTRVGLQLPGFFLHCGSRNPLPLAYIENCADAIALAGAASHPTGDEAYNVHDDEIPTAGQYLRAFKRQVRRFRTVRAPYPAVMMLSRMIDWYHRYSRGQLPAILTPYKSACLWRRFRYDNSKLKSLGWTALVSTAEALEMTFAHFRAVQ